MWILEQLHGLSDPCTLPDKLSCVKIWLLKSCKSWPKAKSLHVLLFEVKYCHTCQFPHSFLRQHMSHHHVLAGIQFLYGYYFGTLYAGVKAYRFNMLEYLNRRQLGNWAVRERRNLFVSMGFPWSQPHATTPWLRSYLRHLPFSGDAIKSLHRLTISHRRRTDCIILPFRFNDSRNLQFIHSVLQISLTEVVGCVSPSWLRQFVKLHLLLPKTLHATLYHLRDFAYHPAGFVIFAKLAQLSIFLIIILIFPILPIVGTCKITQIISNGVQHLLKCCFRPCGC